MNQSQKKLKAMKKDTKMVSSVGGSPQTREADPEIQKMLERMSQISHDIERQVDFICERTGRTRRDLQADIGELKKFDQKAWGRIQSDTERLAAKLEGLERVRVGEAVPVLRKKEDSLGSKERRNKMLGSRKKWIPM